MSHLGHAVLHQGDLLEAAADRRGWPQQGLLAVDHRHGAQLGAVHHRPLREPRGEQQREVRGLFHAGDRGALGGLHHRGAHHLGIRQGGEPHYNYISCK